MLANKVFCFSVCLGNMLTVEEITAWSVDELSTEIRVLLPPDIEFVLNFQEGYFVASLVNKLDGTRIFEEAHPDQRLVLLNTFGHLWSRPSVSTNTPWCRKGEIPRKVVQTTCSLPDPEDLDPSEIQSLYKPR